MPVPDAGSFDSLEARSGISRPFGWIRLTGEVEGAVRELAPAGADSAIALSPSTSNPTASDAAWRRATGFDADLAAKPTRRRALAGCRSSCSPQGKPDDPFMQEHLKTWFELQEELAHLSTNGRHIVATQSAHAIISPNRI